MRLIHDADSGNRGQVAGVVGRSLRTAVAFESPVERTSISGDDRTERHS
ncbi:hypothetical protein [Halorientalis pallida]|nr:hypothetical protein [Halorientalis pallida]